MEQSDVPLIRPFVSHIRDKFLVGLDHRAKSAPADSASLYPLTSDFTTDFHAGIPGDDAEELAGITEDYRRNPEYKSYYHANRALNPRLPPPLPAFPLKGGFDLDLSLGPTAGTDVLGGKSLVDRIQADFPRTLSPAVPLTQDKSTPSPAVIGETNPIDELGARLSSFGVHDPVDPLGYRGDSNAGGFAPTTLPSFASSMTASPSIAQHGTTAPPAPLPGFGPQQSRFDGGGYLDHFGGGPRGLSASRGGDSYVAQSFPPPRHEYRPPAVHQNTWGPPSTLVSPFSGTPGAFGTSPAGFSGGFTGGGPSPLDVRSSRGPPPPSQGPPGWNAGGSGYQGSGWGQQSSHQSYGPPPPGYGGLPRGGSYGSSHGYDGFTTSAPQPHHGYPPASFYEDPYAVPPPHDHRGVTDPYSGGYGYGPSPHTQPDRHYGYSARPERVPPPQMMPQQADPWQERHMRQAPSSGPYGGHSGGRGGYGAREPRESRESRGEYGGHSSYREGPAPSSYGDAPPSRGERRPPRGDGSQTHASLLAELKASLGKGDDLALEDARGRLHLLAQDQHGSRFIQQQLETDDVAVKNAAFDELLPHFPMLITNVFGNYVVQKFLDHGTPEHKAHIADMLIKDMLELTLQMYGCRVVQKGLDVLPRDIIAHMIRRLDGHVVECVEDQNGNHVVQKCIEIAADGVDFIVGSFRGHVRHLSAHPYGCRVIQRVLEHCSVDKKAPILDEVLTVIDDLIRDQYGNYVIQHVLSSGRASDVSAVVAFLFGDMLALSQHKFASNVVERCLEHCNAEEREQLVEEVITRDVAGVMPLEQMMKDQFANYVVQKVFEVATPKQRVIVQQTIENAAHILKKYTYGKHILARLQPATPSPTGRSSSGSTASPRRNDSRTYGYSGYGPR